MSVRVYSRWSTWTVCPWVAWAPSVGPAGGRGRRQPWTHPTRWAASRPRPWCVCPGRLPRRTGKAGAAAWWVWTEAVDYGRRYGRPRAGRRTRCCRSPTGTWRARSASQPPLPPQSPQPKGVKIRRSWTYFRSAARGFWGSYHTPPRRSGPVALKNNSIRIICIIVVTRYFILYDEYWKLKKRLSYTVFNYFNE